MLCVEVTRVDAGQLALVGLALLVSWHLGRATEMLGTT